MMFVLGEKYRITERRKTKNGEERTDRVYRLFDATQNLLFFEGNPYKNIALNKADIYDLIREGRISLV